MISLLRGDCVISIVSQEMPFEAWASRAGAVELEQSPAEGSEKYANLDRVAPHLAAVKSGALFEVGLEVLPDGMERRLERVRPAAQMLDD